ncbi:MAG TPA: HEAT repeat domain-containing protein, partial [bacterium]|nr:HEAT repeat domain-containing protein [bacterium]
MVFAAGELRPFAFVEKALPAGKPEYVMDIKTAVDRTLSIKWSDGSERLMHQMNLTPNDLESVVLGALTSTGGNADALPAALSVVTVERSSFAAEYFTRLNALCVNRAVDALPPAVRKIVFMTSLYDILCRLLSPGTPPSGQLMRSASFLADLLRDAKLTESDFALAANKVCGAGAFATLLSAVKRIDAAFPAAAPARAAAPTAVEGKTSGMLVPVFLDEAAARGLIKPGQRKTIGEIVTAAPPEAGWDIEAVAQLIKLVNDPHRQAFTQITDTRGRPVPYLPQSLLALIQEFKDVPNVGGIFKKIPFDELYLDTSLAMFSPETEKRLKDKAFIAGSMIQGALTELYHALCMRKIEGKPISGFSLSLSRGVKGYDWTEIDTILSAAEGIVESKSRFDFVSDRKGGGKLEDVDSIIADKLVKLQNAVNDGHLAFITNKKVTFTFNRHVLVLIVNRVCERLSADYPNASIQIDFANRQLPLNLGGDLEAGVRRAFELSGSQAMYVNADDIFSAIKKKYENHPSGWEVDIRAFPNVAFMRDDFTSSIFEQGKNRVAQIDAALEEAKKECRRRIAKSYGLTEPVVGTLPESLGYDASRIKQAVERYGIDVLKVNAKGREVEEASKWLAQRDMSRTEGYLRLLSEMRQALEPFAIDMAWRDGFDDPRTNPKVKLMEFIGSSRTALPDLLDKMKKLRDELVRAQESGTLPPEVEFVCDPMNAQAVVTKMRGDTVVKQLNIPQVIGKEPEILSLLVSETAAAGEPGRGGRWPWLRRLLGEEYGYLQVPIEQGYWAVALGSGIFYGLPYALGFAAAAIPFILLHYFGVREGGRAPPLFDILFVVLLNGAALASFAFSPIIGIPVFLNAGMFHFILNDFFDAYYQAIARPRQIEQLAMRSLKKARPLILSLLLALPVYAIGGETVRTATIPDTIPLPVIGTFSVAMDRMGTPELRDILSNATDPGTRAYAAVCLAKMNNPASINALLQCINDRDDIVRAYAAWGLAGMGDARGQEYLFRVIARPAVQPAMGVVKGIIAPAVFREELASISLAVRLAASIEPADPAVIKAAADLAVIARTKGYFAPLQTVMSEPDFMSNRFVITDEDLAVIDEIAHRPVFDPMEEVKKVM